MADRDKTDPPEERPTDERWAAGRDKNPDDLASSASDRAKPSQREWAKGTAKSPDDFDATDEPMTEHQMSHLRVLSEEAGVPFQGTLTRAQAERRIEELQERTGNKP